MESLTVALDNVEKHLFSEWFWLPSGITWADFANREDSDIYIAQPRDLIYCIPTAICLFLIRKLFERFVAYPFGSFMHISTKTHKATYNPTLERLFSKSLYPKENELKAASKQTDLSIREIERWLRTRRNQDRPSQMVKFTETAWRLFFYLFIFIYGVVVLWDKPWFTNPTYCWLDNFPKQHVTNGMFMYYMIELGFYLGLVFSQFVDVKRKDFWEQFCHHIATISLMCFSWICNCVRVGTLVLCLHDVVDWVLESAKLFRYMNKTFYCDVMFGTFTVLWVVTRLIMYPYYILTTTSVEVYGIIGYARSIFMFNVLLWILQILHVLWFIIIFKAAYRALVTGQVEKDIRSASEETGDECSEFNHNHLKNGEVNGHNQR